MTVVRASEITTLSRGNEIVALRITRLHRSAVARGRMSSKDDGSDGLIIVRRVLRPIIALQDERTATSIATSEAYDVVSLFGVARQGQESRIESRVLKICRVFQQRAERHDGREHAAETS